MEVHFENGPYRTSQRPLPEPPHRHRWHYFEDGWFCVEHVKVHIDGDEDYFRHCFAEAGPFLWWWLHVRRFPLGPNAVLPVLVVFEIVGIVILMSLVW